jgi:hypothetical protein
VDNPGRTGSQSRSKNAGVIPERSLLLEDKFLGDCERVEGAAIQKPVLSFAQTAKTKGN